MPPPTIDWQRIGAAHPELKIQSVAFLGEGWTSHSYLVDGSLVFRFPKRAEVWQELEREVAFLAAAADALPLKVPRYASVVRSSAAATHGYAVYSYVPGSRLTPEEFSTAEGDAAVEAIAAFLRTMHDYQPSESTAACLPRVDERVRAIDIRDLAERVIHRQLSTTQAKRLQEWFAWYLDAPASFSFSPVVIHADFSSDHILVSKGCVTGVIDFSDVSFGDPDYDFSSLFIDVGEDFTIGVARRYGHPDPQGLLHKLRYFDIADQIDTILNGAGWALPGQQEAAWQRLRRCLS